MSTFYLIRHGEKNAPAAMLAGRMSGIHLTDLGRRQAERVASQLAREPIVQIYSSPVERARETAEPLARSKGVAVQIDDAFNEYDMGAWTGKTFGALKGDPRWEQFNSLRSLSPPPEGESMLAVQQRFVGRMLALTRAHPRDHIAIVSHGDPIRAALLYFLAAPLDSYARFEIGLASVSIVVVEPHGAQIQTLNQVSPPDAINAVTPA